MDFKKSNAPIGTVTYDRNDIDAPTQNIYESISVIAKRGEQINSEIKKELIEKLEELGLLQRVHQPSGCHGFISAFSGHQHLLICQECGLVEFFSGEDENMGTFMAAIEQQSGFRLEEHWLQLFGVCTNCRQDNAH